MGLYDGYRLSNSNRIQEYQGSPVPEMVQVSQEMQKRYDQTMNTNDYTSRFLNNVDALPQDQAEWQKVAGQYKDKLAEMAKRPDLENATREASILAQNLPTDYAPFASRVKQYQDFVDKVNKDDKIGPETKNAIIQRAVYADKGIQKDPNTGRYKGQFMGYNYVPDLNVEDKVDQWVKDIKPMHQGYKIDKVNGQWVETNGTDTKQIDPIRIREAINSGAALDSQFQNWLHQQHDLATYNMDYSKVDYGNKNFTNELNRQIGTIAGGRDKKGNLIGVPYTVRDAVAEKMLKGKSLTDAMKKVKKDEITNSVLGNMYQYGNKYMQNDKTTEYGLKSNENYWKELEQQKENTIPIGSDILQPKFGKTFTTPQDAEGEMENLRQFAVQKGNDYQQWMTLNGVKAPADPNAPNAKWVDKNGTDVTSAARGYLAEQAQANTTRQQIKGMLDNAKLQAGMDKIPQSQLDAAKEAYNKAYAITKSAVSADPYGGTHGGDPLTESQRRANANSAYQSVLQNTDAYKRYQDILAKNQENQSVHTNVVRFQGKNGEKLNKEVEDMFNNTVVNLDKNGAKSGTSGLEWGTGDNAGRPLEDSDYKKIIGKGSYVGHSFVNGKLYDFFNVGVTKENKDGTRVSESVIVRKPAYPGVMENMLKNGEVNNAYVALTQELNKVNDQYGAPVRVPVGNSGKDFVELQPVTPYEREHNYSNPNDNYKVRWTIGGKSKEFGINSIEEATRHILEQLQGK